VVASDTADQLTVILVEEAAVAVTLPGVAGAVLFCVGLPLPGVVGESSELSSKLSQAAIENTITAASAIITNNLEKFFILNTFLC
jgi:hypothetical protein